MTNFSDFSPLIHAQYTRMAKHELFTVDLGDNDIFQMYLDFFPKGTNPVYRERTEHDCSCCKNFIRNLGNIVAIIDGKIVSVWDVEDAQYPYSFVAMKMSAFVKSCQIENVFRTQEGAYGAEYTNQLTDDGSVIKWHHFHGNIQTRHHTDKAAELKGATLATAQVFRRGLEDLNLGSMYEVLGLIEQNALYRGEEHLESIKSFMGLKMQYAEKPHYQRNQFIWENIGNRSARFRNTVIGTLVQDLSDGMDIEQAVGKFEAKVAPESYKRPVALITPRMVDDAMKTITKLGIEPALERRFARLPDVSVNNVLFVDNSVKGAMKDGVKDVLMSAATNQAPKINNPQDISIDDFMDTVIPHVKSVDLLLENSALSKFMSLTAPVHDDVENIFKWDNNFAWSYDGNFADSIKERVKRAGGNVDAVLRVSLAWFNYDDLDIHVKEPSGNHIFYANMSDKLDVDMNAGQGRSREAVENVSWTGNLQHGSYRVLVNQYQKRESIDVGFTLEVEYDGIISTFSYDKPVKGNVECLRLQVSDGKLIGIIPEKDIMPGDISNEKWGVETGKLIKVNTIMASPNHWDGNETGNKHWFFMLEGCRNPLPTRGIYNEFLKPALEKHRKVFETLGEKTKCEVTDDQLSGVGFSSTRKDQITVVVRGENLQKSYRVSF